MKVGFVITSHYSDKIRPKGQEMLTRIIDSIMENCKYDFNIYIIDNESQYDLQFPEDEKIKYVRVDNQFKKGLTGAWNLGLNMAFEDSCDILIQCNDDLWFNESINYWIDVMKNYQQEDAIFSPVTNGVLLPSKQYADKYRDSGGLVELSCRHIGDLPSGFCFGFSNNHYEKFRHKKNEYFNEHNKYNDGDGKWGGQEGQFMENAERGLFCIIVLGCFVHHDKIRDWKQAREIDRSNR